MSVGRGEGWLPAGAGGRRLRVGGRRNHPAALLLVVALHAAFLAALLMPAVRQTAPAGLVYLQLLGAPDTPASVEPPTTFPLPPLADPTRETPLSLPEVVIKEEETATKAGPRVEPRSPELEQMEQAALRRAQELNAARLREHQARLEEGAARRETMRRAANALPTAIGEQGSGPNFAAVAAVPDSASRYAEQLASLIRPHIAFAVPAGIPPSRYAEFEVRLLPTGAIQEVRRLKTSEVPGYDDAVERAIWRASPFPRGGDGSVGPVVTLRFRPAD